MSQTLTFDGSYNIGVQASGDGITVNVNLPYLHLVQRHLRLRPVRKQLDLLNPYSRAVSLVGRQEDLAILQQWLEGPMAISVRCLIGRAGSGKTRLALELCHLVPDAGWFAGFVERRELARFAGQQNLGCVELAQADTGDSRLRRSLNAGAAYLSKGIGRVFRQI